MRQNILTDDTWNRLIDDSKHLNNRLPFGLRYELGEYTNVTQGALCIRDTHNAEKEVDSAAHSARVIVPVLRSWDSMQVKVHPNAIFASPAKDLENVARGYINKNESPYLYLDE